MDPAELLDCLFPDKDHLGGLLIANARHEMGGGGWVLDARRSGNRKLFYDLGRLLHA